MFAFQHYDITPDMICVAKSLAGGVPIGAVLIGPSVQGFSVGLHGSTFGGNPLACAAANAALQVMEDEDLARQAEEKGEYLMDKLNELNTPIIREIRGLGLMIGIELKQKVAPFMKALQDRRILALNAGLSIIRLLPPLVITYEQIDMLVDALSDVLVPGQHENAG